MRKPIVFFKMYLMEFFCVYDRTTQIWVVQKTYPCFSFKSEVHASKKTEENIIIFYLHITFISKRNSRHISGVISITYHIFIKYNKYWIERLIYRFIDLRNNESLPLRREFILHVKFSHDYIGQLLLLMLSLKLVIILYYQTWRN